METTSLINLIRVAASKLKDGKLKRLNLVATLLDSIKAFLKLDSREEAMILVAIFDRQCAGQYSDLDNLSSYFQTSVLDIMTYVPAINSLVAKGICEVDNGRERLLVKKIFKIDQEVFSCIVEGRKVMPTPARHERAFDQFDFCDSVHQLIDERSNGNIGTEKVFLQIENMEMEHKEMPFVTKIKEKANDIESRALFYEMCHDFCQMSEGGESDLNSMLNDLYDNMLQKAHAKKAILERNHPLILADLIGQSDENELVLTDSGIKLLYGEAASAFIKPYTNLNRISFIQAVDKVLDDMPCNPTYYSYYRLHTTVRRIEDTNPQLTFVSNLKKLVPETEDRIVFYMTCERLINDDTLTLSRGLEKVEDKQSAMYRMRDFKKEKNVLQTRGLAQLGKGGMVDNSELSLTDKGKELFLEEEIDLFETNNTEKELVYPESIKEKKLFFEPYLQNQLSMLSESLAEANYQSMRERLEAKGLPKGIATLLYGLPGTGKTETVMQLAKETGRPIMHVDISATKTCWFGESEKLIKEVFDRYRRLCKRSELTPILLFNEADAVFSKRKDSNSSGVAQTENAIQNIILEEMERLDGILIATTNLAENLDTAFERRFLFKIRFNQPTIEAKQNIWLDKMPALTGEEASQLAVAYDFSGGEIDNIVRKALMAEVIDGSLPSLTELHKLCREEKIGKSQSSHVGFAI